MLRESEQMMCFMAGANAVFTGEQMLTTPCESSVLDVCDTAHSSAKALLGMRYTTGQPARVEFTDFFSFLSRHLGQGNDGQMGIRGNG